MNDPIRILLLEDDPDDARLVERMLRRLKDTPFIVEVTGRLSEATERLAAGAQSYDVILADLTVPDSAGIATLNRLTALAPQLPVVVLTGNDNEALALEALKRGAQDYLVKGVGDAFILSRVVRYAIERKATEGALREARDKAEQAARAKSVFLAMMGHEVRTPLNGVLGMARLLLETPLDHRQRGYAETLVASGELLLGLVNDILDFARLDADGMILDQQVFDPRGPVEEVRSILAARAGQKGLHLTVRYADGLSEAVRGDPLRLRQILFNLVGNALKFTDRGGVDVSVELREDGLIRYCVIDSGIGIPEDARTNLFNEFWQGDSGSARRFAGTGLGLAICRRLALLMGGAIDCQSSPGCGSTFWVDLPLPPADRSHLNAAPAWTPIGVRRVLLVDDNDVNRAVAAGLLEQRGHGVAVAEDGYKGIALAREGGFDVALLDMRMPGLDGIETAQAIAALPGGLGRMPMILLTANPLREDEPRWRAAGILGCLTKPFRVHEFEALLGAWLAGQAGGTQVPAAPGPALVNPDDLKDDVAVLGTDRLRGLADMFRETSVSDMAAMRTMAGEARWTELAQRAHRMAGAAFSLHLGALAAQCRSLEDAARAGDESASVIAQALEPLWQASMEALDRILG